MKMVSIIYKNECKNGAVVKGINTELKIKPLKDYSFTSGLQFKRVNLMKSIRFNIRVFPDTFRLWLL